MRKYIESEEVSQLVSSHPELVEYFALSYVADPTIHSVFKTLFTNEWVSRLRGSVVTEIDKNRDVGGTLESDKASPHPNTEGEGGDDGYSELKDDYRRLIDVATELVGCLERTCRGGTVSPITGSTLLSPSSHLYTQQTRATGSLPPSTESITR